MFLTVALAILLVIHGLIHGLGVAKAFGWADLPQLTQPISPLLGVLWLLVSEIDRIEFAKRGLVAPTLRMQRSVNQAVS